MEMNQKFTDYEIKLQIRKTILTEQEMKHLNKMMMKIISQSDCNKHNIPLLKHSIGSEYLLVVYYIKCCNSCIRQLEKLPLLLYDAMHDRCLCRHAVSICHIHVNC